MLSNQRWFKLRCLLPPVSKRNLLPRSLDTTVPEQLESDTEIKSQANDQDTQANAVGPAVDESSAAASTGRRSERKKRHVRLFCFSCNRYEGHSIASRHRFFYSFLIGLTFGLYFYLGRYTCHCCGSIRLGRYDWINPRYWSRALRPGGSSGKQKRKVGRKSKRS